MGEEEKKSSEQQVTKAPGRKQMTALWVAVATALGSTGIPRIVTLLENKPSVEMVQSMISKDASVLTERYNASVKVIAELKQAVREMELKIERIEKGCCSETLKSFDEKIPPSAVQACVEEKLKAPEELFQKPQEREQGIVPPIITGVTKCVE